MEALGFLGDIRQRRLAGLNASDTVEVEKNIIEGLRKYRLRKGLLKDC